MKKTKLKAKGKKYYKNTHGTVYRIKPKPINKLNKKNLIKKSQSIADEAQLKEA